SAIAARILGEILLVIILSEIKWRRLEDLGRDCIIAFLPECRFKIALRGFRHLPLRTVKNIDARAVLRTDVIALPHALRRVVVFPKGLEQLSVAHLFRIENDEHRLAVAGAAGT